MLPKQGLQAFYKGLTAMSTRLTLCDTSGPLIDLIQKLSGEEGEIWSRALNKMLRKENPWKLVAENCKVFKTIKLGTGLKTADDFRKALVNGCYHISVLATTILDRPEFTVATQETEIDLVAISVAELGFKEGAKRQDIYERTQELGLALCPAEVGPQLRLQYKDQPKGEWFIIAMKPITHSDGSLYVFRVGHDDVGLWLRSSYGNPDNFWHADSRWVFLRRKPARNA